MRLNVLRLIAFIFAILHGATHASWEFLPDDVQSIIFSHLPVKDLGNCALVSKRWRKNSECNLIWDKKLSIFLRFDMQLLLKMSANARFIYNNNYKPTNPEHLIPHGAYEYPYPGAKTLMRYLIERKSTTGWLIAEQIAASAMIIVRPGKYNYRDDLVIECRQPEETPEIAEPMNLDTNLLETIILTSEKLGSTFGTNKYLTYQVNIELAKNNLTNDRLNPKYSETERAVFDKYIALGWQQAIWAKELFYSN